MEQFNVRLKHQKEKEDGKLKGILESYVFEGVNFSDAETHANTLIEEFSMREAKILSIARVNYDNVFKTGEGLLFEVKVKEEIEGDNGKPQIIGVKYLILAGNVSEAETKMNEEYKGTQISFTVHSVRDPHIMDYIEVKK